MKKFVIVIPTRVTNAENTHSRYTYPDSPGLSREVITYNRNLPDFFMEQLWLIEGDDKDIDAFIANPSVTSIIDWDAANTLSNTWNPPVEYIADPKAVLDALEILKSSITLPPSLDSEDAALGVNKKVFSLDTAVPSATFYKLVP
jgi:hypothetical protein